MIQAVLVGITAAGKTTVGEHLARRLGLPFVDTDTRIEQNTGQLVREIFSDQGETVFREVEEQTVAEVLTGDGVVALGGGAVLSPATRAALRAVSAPVVWLDVTVATATRRLGMAVIRPVLLHELRRRLEGLLEQRRAWYQEVSDHQIAVDRLTVEQIVDQIVALLRIGVVPQGQRR